jgi:hypothetical protein
VGVELFEGNRPTSSKISNNNTNFFHSLKNTQNKTLLFGNKLLPSSGETTQTEKDLIVFVTMEKVLLIATHFTHVRPIYISMYYN